MVALVARVRREGIPFVRPAPCRAQMTGSGMAPILAIERSHLELRVHDMTDELGPDQLIDIPAPGILRIAAGTVQPDKATALLHPFAERVTLLRRQDVAAHAVPYYSLEAGKLVRVEYGGILGRVAAPATLSGNLLQRTVRGNDLRVVAKAIGLGKNENSRVGKLSGDLRRRLVIAAANAQDQPTKITRPYGVHEHQ